MSQIRHPFYRTFIMADLPHLPNDVQAARRHMAEEGIWCGFIARELEVSKQFVKMVISGRERSARVLSGIMSLHRDEWAKAWALEMEAKRGGVVWPKGSLAAARPAGRGAGIRPARPEGRGGAT